MCLMGAISLSFIISTVCVHFYNHEFYVAVNDSNIHHTEEFN